jgi:DNA-binding MarR family transcriptional regulator
VSSSTTRTSTTTDAAPHWLDEREHAAWRSFLTMHAQLTARLAHEMKRDADLSGADYSVLVGVSEAPCGRIRANELGAELQWEKSRLSKQITRMEERGLLARESCPTDARGSFVVLTDLGRQTIERAAPLHVEQVRALFVEVLTAEQLDQLREIATTVIDALGCDGKQPED